MIAFYDKQPAKLEAVGNGSYIYRFNIAKKEIEDTGEENPTTNEQWECEEVIVWAPLSSNKITKAVITEKWDNNQEQKLVNEYNSAMIGITKENVDDKIQAYKDYLTEREEIKNTVDNDCKELGIR